MFLVDLKISPRDKLNSIKHELADIIAGLISNGKYFREVKRLPWENSITSNQLKKFRLLSWKFRLGTRETENKKSIFKIS